MGLFSSLKKKIKGTVGGKILSKSPGGKKLLGGSKKGSNSSGSTSKGMSFKNTPTDTRDSEGNFGSRSGMARLRKAAVPLPKPSLTGKKPGVTGDPRPPGRLNGGMAKPMRVLSTLGGTSKPRRRPTGV